MEYEKEIFERITAVEQSVKSSHHRIDNIEKLTESVHTIAVEMKAMREDMNGLNERMAEIEKKPGKRLDSIINILLTVFISGVGGYLIGLILK